MTVTFNICKSLIATKKTLEVLTINNIFQLLYTCDIFYYNQFFEQIIKINLSRIFFGLYLINNLIAVLGYE